MKKEGNKETDGTGKESVPNKSARNPNQKTKILRVNQQKKPHQKTTTTMASTAASERHKLNQTITFDTNTTPLLSNNWTPAQLLQTEDPPVEPPTPNQTIDDECRHWLSKIENFDSSLSREAKEVLLKDAPYHIQNNKRIVMAAIEKTYGFAFQYASPSLKNDKKFILAAVEKSNEAFQYASLSLQNDRRFVLDVVKEGYGGGALKYASPYLQNDRQFVLDVVKEPSNGVALQYVSSSLRNDKQVVMAAILGGDGHALEYASPDLRNDKQIVIAAIRRNSNNLEYASPELQNDKDVAMAAVSYGHSQPYSHVKDNMSFMAVSPSLKKDKDIVIAAVKQNGRVIKYAPPSLQNDKQVIMAAAPTFPDIIKVVPEELKRDPDILTACGMFDKDHKGPTVRTTKKIVLSTRFALVPSSKSEATNLTAQLKMSEYIQNGNFTVYAPNAFDKKTCDPEWTNFGWPCRGTKDTCGYNNILKDGHPTDDCCWRYSFRSQLQEATDTGGFMLQLVESESSGKTQDAALGHGQQIELDMANAIGVKVFQVYRPFAYSSADSTDRDEWEFVDEHIDAVTRTISHWYENECDDISVERIYWQPYGDDRKLRVKAPTFCFQILDAKGGGMIWGWRHGLTHQGRNVQFYCLYDHPIVKEIVKEMRWLPAAETSDE